MKCFYNETGFHFMYFAWETDVKKRGHAVLSFCLFWSWLRCWFSIHSSKHALAVSKCIKVAGLFCSSCQLPSKGMFCIFCLQCGK